MAIMILLDELENVSYWRDLCPRYFRHIAALAQLVEFPADTVLFRERQSAPHIYFVLEGEVALTIQAAGERLIALDQVGPGELLGWSPLLRLGPMTATARTLTRCRLTALDADQVLARCQDDPAFGAEFFRCLAAVLARRLSATRRRLPAAPRPRGGPSSKSATEERRSGKPPVTRPDSQPGIALAQGDESGPWG
jgi:CRP-like cAMP-binding protein